jgi:hypothetical protein
MARRGWNMGHFETVAFPRRIWHAMAFTGEAPVQN